MNLLLRTSAAAILCMAAASAQATITLPTNGTSVRFDGGTMVFDTSLDPTINDATGFLNQPQGDIGLTAFGDINHIVNNQSSNPGTGDIGSISSDQQLTFALTNARLAPTDVVASSANNANSAKFTITSNVVGVNASGPTLTLYNKNLNAAAGLNTQAFIGTDSSGGVPAAVTSGTTPYLTFENMPNVTATIIVRFDKVNGSTVFNRRTALLQSFSAEGVPVTGGSVSAQFTIGEALTGNQVRAAEVSETAAGTPIGNDATWVSGNYALVVQRIPEPASLALVAMGAGLIGLRRRRQVEA